MKNIYVGQDGMKSCEAEKQDAQRIALVLEKHKGLAVTWEQAHAFWEKLSENDYSAGWITVPSDDKELMKMIDRYRQVVK